MNIPFIDLAGSQFVEYDGRLSPVSLNFLMQLLLQLQENLSNEGFIIPSQTAAKIANLTNSTNGTLIYNSDTNKLMIQINGTWIAIDTSLLVPPFVWNVVTSVSEAMVSFNGYLSNFAGLITYTLPTSSNVGDIIRVAEMNASGSFTITQNSGQQIQFGSLTTTLGMSGSLSSTAVGNSVELICTVANTNWLVLSNVGVLTIV